MYVSHLKIGSTKIGLGLFTDIKLPANQPLIEAVGTFYKKNELQNSNNDDYILQVGVDSFIDISGNLRHINHSCNPNCLFHIVGNRIILYSMFAIKANSELTFDYSSTSTDSLDEWQMDCRCGEYNCRKVITGFQFLHSSIQKNMIFKEMIPLYLKK